jgi:hypothetical protein
VDTRNLDDPNVLQFVKDEIVAAQKEAGLP